MKKSKQKKLEAAGWTVGSAFDFLKLGEAEIMIVNMKLALANEVKAARKRKRITQDAFAKMIGSSQSRVAKLENADSSVSMELLIKSLATLGESPADIGTVLSRKSGSQLRTKSRKSKVGISSKVSGRDTSRIS
jgi:DNA-binding XRE family transcriptional regulator